MKEWLKRFSFLHLTNWEHVSFPVEGMDRFIFELRYRKATREDPLNLQVAHSLVFRFIGKYHSVTWGHRYLDEVAEAREKRRRWNRVVTAKRRSDLLSRHS